MRGFAPILVILLIVVLASMAAGGYYFVKLSKPAEVQPVYQTPASPSSVSATPESSSSADMANWKTYTNLEHKFSMNYPDNKKIEIGKERNSCRETVVGENLFFYPVEYVDDPQSTHFQGELIINIAVLDNPDNLTPEAYLEKECPWRLSKERVALKQNIEVAGINGLLIDDTIGAYQIATRVIIPKGNKLYYIDGQSYRDNQNSLFKNILTTFKF